MSPKSGGSFFVNTMLDITDIIPAHTRSETNPEARIVVTAARQDSLMDDLETRLAAGRGFSLATLNLDHIVKIVRDPVFYDAYTRQSIVTADGNPVVWLCRLAGQDVSLIPGAELVDPIAGMAARLHVPVALLGATEGALQAAAQVLEARYPALKVATRIAPSMGFDPVGPEAKAAVAALGEAFGDTGPGLVFLALGAPKQECFAAFAQDHLPQVGFVSIGAGLDFIAGTQQRAPKLVRRLALEWAWRLLLNPLRLMRRYAACFAILPQAGRAALRARRRPRYPET